jgi:hypothetical protein
MNIDPLTGVIAVSPVVMMAALLCYSPPPADVHNIGPGLRRAVTHGTCRHQRAMPLADELVGADSAQAILWLIALPCTPLAIALTAAASGTAIATRLYRTWR